MASSCIRSEGPNAEADIIECTVDGVTLRGEPVITNTAVMVLIASGSDRSALAPEC